MMGFDSVALVVGVPFPEGAVYRLGGVSEPAVSWYHADGIAGFDKRLFDLLVRVRRVPIPGELGTWFGRKKKRRASFLWVADVDGEYTAILVVRAVRQSDSSFCVPLDGSLDGPSSVWVRHFPFVCALWEAVLDLMPVGENRVPSPSAVPDRGGEQQQKQCSPVAAADTTGTAGCCVDITLQLDDDLLVNVFSWMNGATLYHASMTCRRWSVLSRSHAVRSKRGIPQPSLYLLKLQSQTDF